MEEAKAAILAIVDPPKAELGKVYNGRVVNITKFGAFVNILPGRDGLVHISKLGGGKRINAVEDVLSLGQELEVRVDEIDDKGKVSLTPAGDAPSGESSGGGGSSRSDDRSSSSRDDRGGRSDDRSDAPATTGEVVSVSFEETFDAELAGELGDLGPDSPRERASTGGDSRGGRGAPRGGDRDRGRRRHR